MSVLRRLARLGGCTLAIALVAASALAQTTLPDVQTAQPTPPAPATDPPPRVDPVVITPGRIQQQAGEAPASVTVIPADDIRRSPSQTVDDLLRQVPSFSLFRRSSSLVTHPTAQGVSLRGVGPSGASRALVLVDGVPVNDPFGGWVPWSRIPALSIDQIEVVRGGGSAVWGSGALGGVIQVLTRRPRARGLAFEVSHGSYDTTNVDLLVTEARGPFRVALEGNWFETGGFEIVKDSDRGPIDIDADSQHGVFNGRVEMEVSPDLTLFVSGNYFDEDRQNGTRLQLNDTVATSFATGANLRTRDGGEWQVLLFAQEQTFHSTFSTQTLDRAAETLALDQRSPSESLGGAVSWTRAFGAHTLLAGIDGRWIEGETDEKVFVAGTFARRRRAGGDQILAGAYVQDTIALARALDLTLGLRGDYFTTYHGRRRDTPPPAGVPAHQEFSDLEYLIPSPRIAALYRATPATDVQASVYQGFRAPTLNELYRVFRVRNDVTAANEHLEPERLTGGELGVRQRFGMVDARVTGFWNEVKDQILNVTLASRLGDCPGPTTCRQRRNVDRARIRGIEGEVEVPIGKDWRLVAAHLYSDAKVVDASGQPALEGKRLAQVPRHVTTAGVRWDRPEWVSVNVLARFVGSQFEDDLNTLPLGRYTVLDVHLSRAVAPWGTVFLAVENLTGEEYAVARTSDGVVSVGSPRVVRGGVRVTF
ncbi:MAG: TonB-dependent receptor [Candidatus Rokubacteria bacterium]|nr:TonB-dependent receptor [Candidatus Rokubacteria bacterium]